jgi:hypothetical protein
MSHLVGSNRVEHHGAKTMSRFWKNVLSFRLSAMRFMMFLYSLKTSKQ